jgi:hypothetical protein
MKKTAAISCVWMVLASAPVFCHSWSHSWAQSKKDPLTEQQVEDVREAGTDPPQRIKLFAGYIEDRTTEIHTLNTDRGAQNKGVRIHQQLEEFTRLADDLEDNMDNFNEQHADLRKVLKEVIDKSAAWTAILNEPPPSSQYDFARKTALEANQSVHESATQMLDEQTKYFIEKKKEEKEQQKQLEQKQQETR